jgi:hypothetical protein
VENFLNCINQGQQNVKQLIINNLVPKKKEVLHDYATLRILP